MFESLGKSNIEGIEILARQFHTVSMNLKRNLYDVLAPTAEVETHFTKFMFQISHIEVLYVFLIVLLSPSYIFSIVSSVHGHIVILAILIYRNSCGHS